MQKILLILPVVLLAACQLPGRVAENTNTAVRNEMELIKPFGWYVEDGIDNEMAQVSAFNAHNRRFLSTEKAEARYFMHNLKSRFMCEWNMKPRRTPTRRYYRFRERFTPSTGNTERFNRPRVCTPL